MPIVYQHRRNDTNEVFYVGIGQEEARAYDHNKACGRSKHWFHVTRKHGHTVEISHRDVIWEEACAIERYLIAFYGRRDLGFGTLVNMTDGGDGSPGHIMSEDVKKRITEQTRTPERIAISRENFKAAHTPESRKKARDNRDYKHIGDVQKIPCYQYNMDGSFIREWPSGKDAAKELNLSYKSINHTLRKKASSAGGYMWSYDRLNSLPKYTNKMKSDEYRHACGERMAKAVSQYDLDGNFIRDWPSASEAARSIGAVPTNISACCIGRSKTSNGFIWQYYTSNN